MATVINPKKCFPMGAFLAGANSARNGRFPTGNFGRMSVGRKTANTPGKVEMLPNRMLLIDINRILIRKFRGGKVCDFRGVEDFNTQDDNYCVLGCRFYE